MLSLSLHAQVTIGSGETPLKGTLLDLKEYKPKADNTTATRGLGMPRMKLTALDELTVAGADKNEEHTGLMIYNLNECDGFSPGLYVWEGAKWQRIGAEKPARVPKITFSPDTLRFTSGSVNDKPIETKSFQVSWSPSDASITSLAPSTGVRAIKWQAPVAPIGILPDNPTTFSSLTPRPMDAEFLDDRAAKVLSSTMRFRKTNSCGVYVAQQSYVMLQVKRGFTAKHTFPKTAFITPDTGDILLTFHADGKKVGGFATSGNTEWEAKIMDNTLLTSLSATHNGNNTASLTGGKEMTNKELKADSAYYTTTNSALARYSYFENVLVFSDKKTPKRFEDLKVSGVVCSGPIPSSASVALAPGVSRYQDQDQNWFLARKFSTAGTWMLQNLSAKKFDPIRDNGETVLRPIVGGVYPEDYFTPIWIYPNIVDATDFTDPSVFDADTRLGLLYNWAAASNSKGGSDGEQNNIEEGGASEGPRRQGICPSGWHLPSDREWILLENEIRAHSSLYTYRTDVGGGVEGTASENKKIGRAMQDICIDPGLAPDTAVGLSKAAHQGGFDILFPGNWYRPTSSHPAGAVGFGSRTMFYTSSSGYSPHQEITGPHVYVRTFSSASGIWVGQSGLGVEASVRCKKNID